MSNKTIIEDKGYNITSNLLSSLIELEFQTIEEKYNMILSFVNLMLKPTKQYDRLTQFKNVLDVKLSKTAENKELIQQYLDKFESVGFKINKKSVNVKSPIYILNCLLKQINYKLKKKINNEQKYYTIITNNL